MLDRLQSINMRFIKVFLTGIPPLHSMSRILPESWFVNLGTLKAKLIQTMLVAILDVGLVEK